MTDGMNMTESEARQVVAHLQHLERAINDDRLYTTLEMATHRYLFAQGVLHGLSLGRKEADGLAEILLKAHDRVNSDICCTTVEELASQIDDIVNEPLHNFYKERQNG